MKPFSQNIININAYNFLVVGLGSIGERHINNLKTLGITKIIACDVNRGRRELAKKKWHIATYPNLKKALETRPQVALICSPTALHLKHALLSAASGCHLFIEKPLSHQLKGVEKLIRITKKKKLKTFVSCNFRFHPGIRYVKNLLNRKIIGDIFSIRSEFGQYLPNWRPNQDYRKSYSSQKKLGGGILLDRIHELDYLMWLFGNIGSIIAVIDRISDLKIDTEDIVDILCQFKSGPIASIHLDYLRRTYNCRLEIIGNNGIIEWVFQKNHVRYFSIKNGIWKNKSWENETVNNMYISMMKTFLEVLRKPYKETNYDINCAKKVIKCALSAKLSSKLKKSIIIKYD